MNKYRYKINNLDCANCARRIEDSLNKNKDYPQFFLRIVLIKIKILKMLKLILIQ